MRKRKTRSKPRTLYLGFDGAYVLSRLPLKKFKDPNGSCEFLATGRKFSCFDVQPDEGKIAFGHLRLKEFQVVKLTFHVGMP